MNLHSDSLDRPFKMEYYKIYLSKPYFGYFFNSSQNNKLPKMILQRILIHVKISSGQKISDLYSKVDCKWGCKDMIYILNLLKQFDRIQNRIIVSKCPHTNFERRDLYSNNVWYQKLPSFSAVVRKSHDCRLNTTILVLLMYI